MNETLTMVILGIAFAVISKPIDLIDENGWIGGKLGFVLKYVFVLLSSFVVYWTIEMDKTFVSYFLAIFLFWTLNNKFEYPSHVLYAFIPAILIGRYIDVEYTVLALIGLMIYWLLEFIVKKSDNKLIKLLLYKSLARFLVVPLLLSAYFGNFNITIYTACGLLSMHIVRKLIKQEIIKINPQTINAKGEN